MAVLPIVEIPDPGLRLVSKPVDAVDDAVRALVADMIETMYDAHGIGLAAIQVGVDSACSSSTCRRNEDDGGQAGPRPARLSSTPKSCAVSDEMSTVQRGLPVDPRAICRGRAPRRAAASAGSTATARPHEEEMDGLLATCMQHEIDHLNGVLFIDHISRLKRDMIQKLARRGSV